MAGFAKLFSGSNKGIFGYFLHSLYLDYLFSNNQERAAELGERSPSRLSTATDATSILAETYHISQEEQELNLHLGDEEVSTQYGQLYH